LMTAVCIAQGQAKAQKTPDRQALETIKGTINYNERMGGYFIKGVEPGGELFIVNQDVKTLKRIKESNNIVTFEGHYGKGGAEYFIIEKIDGKKYSAAKANSKKTKTKGY
ncbi:MAG: hypothetical protein ABFD50_21675, partial [Smithella sp.]